MRGNNILFLILIFLSGSLPGLAQNPWQQDKGEFLLSPFLSSYRATAYRDRSGDKIDFTDQGRFSNVNPRLYFSMPIKNYKVNLFGTVPLFFNKYRDNNQHQKNTDWGEMELGARVHITQLKNNYLLGAVTAFFPVYTNDKVPFTGYDRFGMEGRLMLYGNAPWLGSSNNFHKLEAGVRYFFPDDPLQLRIYASEGIRFGGKWVALGELDCIFSTSENSDFFEGNLQLVSDFSMVKAALNLGYEFTPDLALYGGLFHDIYNRNSGIGSGFQVFSVIKLR